MNKKIIITILVFICIIASAAVYYISFNKDDAAARYRIEKAVLGDISSSVTATGTLSAVTTVTVGTQVSGTIKQIYVDYNSPVKKGQLIAQIDPDTFEAQVNQARANLNLAKANLLKSEVALVDAERNLARYKMLIERELIAKSEYDTALTNTDTARAQVSASKAQIEQTQAALKVAEINLSNTRIVSPVDGVVVSRNVDVGQTVAASFQTPTLFSIAQDLTKMQVVSSVVEADIGTIESDQPVEFTVDAHREMVFKGRVSQVRIAPITVQNVVTYEVIILVDNPEHKLKPGMTANVSIIVDSKDNVLKIPNAALRFRMPESAQSQVQQAQGQQGQRQQGGQKGQKPGGPTGTPIWTLEAGKPKRVVIKTGISDGQFTEVLSGDIKEGSDLIVESLGKKTGSTTRQQQSGPRMF